MGNAIEQVLSGHQPYPALVVDWHLDLVLANRAPVLDHDVAIYAFSIAKRD